MYLLPESPLPVPEPLQDRSVNVLTYVEPSTQAPFQLVVNRDELLGDETIPACIDRQIGLLTRQVQQFKILRRHQQERPDGLQPLYTLESSFQQGGRAHHQLQCMLVARTPKVLVITLASGVPLNDGHRRFWDDMLSRFDPAAAASQS